MPRQNAGISWCMKTGVMLNLFVTLTYGLTDYSANTRKDEFYNELVSFVRRCRGFDVVLVVGDFSAQVEKRSGP